jgi:hypothetical protein
LPHFKVISSNTISSESKWLGTESDALPLFNIHLLCCHINESAVMTKRQLELEELHHFDEINKPVANATVHGAITSLSPLKKGRNSSYFDGAIADDTTKLRLVGFSSNQQRKLSNFFSTHTIIQLQNCQIKESREGDKMEVMLKTNTNITKSSKEIDTSNMNQDEASSIITLSQLLTTQNFQKVTVDIKVMNAKAPVYVTGEKLKQDIIIADETGTAKVTLWEKHVQSLQNSKSYTLKNFTVREYSSKKYLSMPREGASITNIADIGEVEDSLSDTECEIFELHNAQITGVQQLDSYNACLTCKARVEPESPPLGRCSKCGMMQRLDLCPQQMSAKLLFSKKFPGDPETTTKTLHAFGRMIQDLAATSQSEVTREDLLLSPLVTVTYNDKKVVTSFLRE